MATESSSLKIAKFDGTPAKWDDFKFHLRNLLEMRDDDLAEYVFTAVAKPGKAGDEAKWNQKRSKAYSAVAVHLESAGLAHIRNVERDGHVAYLALEGFYEKKSVQNVLSLKMVLFGMKMGGSEPAYLFAHRVQEIVQRLKVLEVETPDEDICAIILAGLDERYASLVTAMDLSESFTSMTLLEKLQVFDDRMERNGTDVSTVGLIAKGANRHGSNLKKDMVCFKCGGKGHMARECTGKSAQANMTLGVAGVSEDHDYVERFESCSLDV
jgi:hypothetical protein